MIAFILFLDLLVAIPADEGLTTAQVCHLEATWRRDDCVAMVDVAKRRAARVKRPWIEVLREYSALDKGSTRANEIREYPDGDVPGKNAVFNRRWAALRKYVRRVLAGEVRSPCRGADHWGARDRRLRDHVIAARAVSEGRWVHAVCSTFTANAFYRQVR